MEICNINISCPNIETLLEDTPHLKHIITVNAEAIVRSQKDTRLKNILNTNTTTIDGEITLWLYKLKHPNEEINKISGSDLIYDLCKWAEKKQFKIFLLGGNDISNRESVKVLKKKFNIEIDGYSPPYSPYPFSEDHNKMIIKKIKEFSPDILMVGFGMGKQEFWINDNYNILNQMCIKLAIGCGGTFEFVSGKIKRAPRFIQKSGLEGVWRLIMEPKLFRIKRLITSFKIFYYFIK